MEDLEFETLPRAELVERARALQTVLLVAREAALGGSFQEVAARFVAAVASYTRFAAVAVLRFLREPDRFELQAQQGFDESKFPPSQALPRQGSLTGLAADLREMLTTDDIPNDPRVPADVREALGANQYVSGACVPLLHDDELLGSFNLIYPLGTALPDGERRMVGALGNMLAVALAQRVAVEREQALEQQARRAQQLESLGVLAAGIAHDFNNLLTGIIGNVELARVRADAAGQKDVAQVLSEALDAGERAGKLSGQLLTFSRGGSPSQRVEHRLGRLLEEVATFAARGTSVRCEVDVQEPLGAVEIDAGQIAQVVQNLVLNACQASPSGSTVTVRARRVNGEGDQARVIIEVIDQGCGIAPEHLARVFEPFFSQRSGGTGLGLTVSHSIVRRHGGGLTVASELEAGTTFTLWLPSASASAAENPPRRAGPRSFAGRVLLMDDDAQVRVVASQMLRQLGFEVDVAEHGAQALQMAQACTDANAYRLAVLDLTVVGGLGGTEIAGQLRESVPGIRLVLSSGYARQTHTHWDGQLRKPFRLEALADVVEAALGGGGG